MAFCLPLDASKRFLQALKDGTINPEKLIDMSSEERRAFFEKIVGKDDAREVNAQLESKLLLKDQKRGMVSWAKKVAGITEEVRRDMISRIEKMDKMLSPADQHSFLEDLAAKKLGTDISFEEAKTITSLSKKISNAKAAIKPTDPVGSPTRLDYGAKYVALQNYMHELKLSNADSALKEIANTVKTSPRRALLDSMSKLAGVAKGLKASFDNSFGGRQGFRAIFTNPKTWATNFAHSFEYIAKQLGRSPHDNTVMDAIKADVFSRPNALNGLYRKMKLDVGIDTEEAYPTTLPERIPGIGRLYKASEVAYNGMAIRLRADIADQVISVAENNGHDLTDKLNTESLGRLVNALTGRGSLGSLEKVGKNVNTLFFSPKSLKASFDFLTLHAGDEMSAYSRMQAAKNLLKVTAGMAVIFGIAKALNPNSVTFDTNSADFGKIRVGDTRFDVSGGMSSLVVLASRLVTGSQTISTTGKSESLTSGKFGAPTRWNAIVNFASNKSSPLFGTVINWAKGQDPNGNPVTPLNTINNLLMPLPVTNVQELMSNPKSANPLLAEMFDAIGFVTNTYSPKPKKK